VAQRSSRKGVRILSITGSQGKLPLEPDKNTAGIAAREVLKLLKVRGGVELALHKNIPGNGLGSSAASAVAAGFAVNILFGHPLRKEELIIPCAVAESQVSGGYFLDNISASLLGGVVLTNPTAKTAISLGTLHRAVVVLVTPFFPLPTKRARKVLPKRVSLALFVQAQLDQ
jgi:homoserine kinase